jgi:hypothetical protein
MGLGGWGVPLTGALAGALGVAVMGTTLSFLLSDMRSSFFLMAADLIAVKQAGQR